MRKKEAEWMLEESYGQDRSQPKLRIVRGEVGKLIRLQIDLPELKYPLVKENRKAVRQKLHDAVDNLREALKSRQVLPPVHEGKIMWGKKADRFISLEIDAPKIRSVGKTQKASVRRKIRTALDAIKEGIDSPAIQGGRILP